MISAKALLDYGMSMLGVPYKWGGNDPYKGVDCSGLLQQMFLKFGINLPRVSRDQAKVGTGVTAANARPGDLVAFDVSDNRPGVDHIAVYLGGGKMLVAPRTGTTVRVENVDLSRAVTIRRVTNMDFQGIKNNAYDTAGAKVNPSTQDSATGDADKETGAMATDAEVRAAIRRDYGYLAAFMDHKEIGPILMRAAKEGWDSARLQGALSKTNWYKKTSETARTWDARLKLDPATARQQLKLQEQQIMMLAKQMGVRMTPKRLTELATQVLRGGWDMSQVRYAIGAEFEYKPGKRLAGQGATIVDQIRQIASDYVVNLSNNFIDRWGEQILSGTETIEGFKAEMVRIAKGKFPSMGKALDSGQTVRQYADPYVQHAAQLLGINDDDIDLSQAKWQKSIFSLDPKTKERRSLTIDEWDKELKSNATYGYANTDGARETVAGFAMTLGKLFGRTA